jgi:putative FmdB family regulatory protein
VPTYQYACTDCGDRSEVVQRFTDDPLTVCSACGGKLRKVFSPVGIVFKGSGFYRTDSRSASSTVPAGSSNGSGSSSESSASSNGSSGDSSSSKSDSGSSSEKKSSPATPAATSS